MNIGDVFIYGSHGICEVTGLQDMCMDEKISQYYVLKPVYHAAATVYISSISSRRKTEIRHILSADEIFSLLKKMPDKDHIWNNDNRKRKELYRQILADGNHYELVKMVKTLRWHKQEIKNTNKNNKLQISDEDFLKDAEKALCEEFAYVLNIKREEVIPFIYEQ
ncbi:CarD family transcriptional regulator [Lacrimispora xylanisolvens]|jgi:CarD family transcriptional regulator|uniref:CarD family transcriptional regulator n=1 Tax=Lacrimispora xylanisolvens TaxID=384636 RepID=A0A2S6HUD3_9FIRM|nr:CarD family transcriptional regulator [Hungatella xylanolytica]PPK81441.1 CarD family transcriptional regulator [Hungatella xylanolytica]